MRIHSKSLSHSRQRLSVNVQLGTLRILASVHLMRVTSVSCARKLVLCSDAFRNCTFLPSLSFKLALQVHAQCKQKAMNLIQCLFGTAMSRPMSRPMMSAGGWSDQIPNLLHCFFRPHDSFWKNTHFSCNRLTKLNDSSPRCEIFPEWKSVCSSGLFCGHFTHLLLCRWCADRSKQISAKVRLYLSFSLF